MPVEENITPTMQIEIILWRLQAFLSAMIATSKTSGSIVLYISI